VVEEDTELTVVDTSEELDDVAAAVLEVRLWLVDEEEEVSVTGQMVVDRGIVTVVNTVDLAGQFVTAAEQLVMVRILVVNTVDVLY